MRLRLRRRRLWWRLLPKLSCLLRWMLSLLGRHLLWLRGVVLGVRQFDAERLPSCQP